MVKGVSIFIMVHSLKDGSIKLKLWVKIISLFILMALFIEEPSKIHKKMDLESSFFIMATNTLDFGKMINHME